MFREALGNYGFGNREQLTNRRVERLKFFRRTAHVVSMIAPLLLIAMYASAQPKQDTKTNTAGNNKAQAQPPIQITVTTPDKSPADKAREDQRQEREVTAQERVADFTRILTYAAIAQGLATFIALLYAIRSANAARSAAETAADQLRRALTPIIEVATAHGDGTFYLHSTSPDRQRFTYVLRMQLMNVGPAPARVLRIDWSCLITNEPDIEVASNEGFTLGSGRPRETDVLIEISTATRDVMNTDGLNIRLKMMLELHHPISGPFWHTYELWLHQFSASPIHTQDRRDYSGRPENQGQSQDQPQRNNAALSGPL
jgi:hypothetical protein